MGIFYAGRIFLNKDLPRLHKSFQEQEIALIDFCRLFIPGFHPNTISFRPL
jgi:hypothetical protein